MPLTVLAALTGAWLALDALSPPEEPRTEVLVAARALAAGSTLGPGDARRVSWPLGLVPDDVAEEVEGRALAVGVPAGTPLVEGVLAPADLFAAAPPGTVAAPVRLADAELAGLLSTGDRVDVLAARPEGGEAERVARRALVLSGPTQAAASGGGLLGGAAPSPSGLVLLAVGPEEARALAGHAASGVLSAVLVP